MGLTEEALEALEEERTGAGRQQQYRQQLEQLLRGKLPAAKDGQDFRFSKLVKEHHNWLRRAWDVEFRIFWTGTAAWTCDGYEFKVTFKHLGEDKFWGHPVMMSKPGSSASYPVNTLAQIGKVIEDNAWPT